MNPVHLSLREIQEADIPFIIDYWQKASPGYLNAMGADPALLPDASQWQEMLSGQIHQPYADKKSYCLIWVLDGKPAGHCNVNKIIFCTEAYMHLHLWHPGSRRSGAGAQLVKMALPYFFGNLQLQVLYSEPYALNPGPNNTLRKCGFRLADQYITVPGSINFEQPVNLWEMTAAQFAVLQHP